MASKDGRLIVRVLYREILRAGDRLARSSLLRSRPLLVDNEAAWLNSNSFVPIVRPNASEEAAKMWDNPMAMDKTSVRQCIREYFMMDGGDFSSRLDQGFRALSALSSRAKVGEAALNFPPSWSEMVTNGIKVTVHSHYFPGRRQRSSPQHDKFSFGYNVDIENVGNSKVVQVKTRKWTIIDLEGVTEDVAGEGVVGHEPFLFPTKYSEEHDQPSCFSYASSANVTTPLATMLGSYGVVDEDGNEFDVEIGAFGLIADPTHFY